MQKHPFYKGLNGLRFFAAASVAIFHFNNSIISRGITTVHNFSDWSIFNNGGLAVEFFFVLSGFLITSLLIVERANYGTVDIKKFYIRRCLRIWPLYYLMVFIYFAIVPILINVLHLNFEYSFSLRDLILYVFLLPNVVGALGAKTMLNPLWSIGVEEMFYAFWAPLMKYLGKHLLTILISIVVLKTGISYANTFTENQVIKTVIYSLKFECMAIGGLGAYVVHRRKQLLDWFFSNPMQIFYLTFLIFIVFFRYSISGTELWPAFQKIQASPLFCLLTSFLFLMLILNVSLNAKSFIKLENKVLHSLGEVSYGTYMYHVLIQMVILNVARNWLSSQSGPMATITAYTVFMAAVLAVSYLSYHLFEKRFLKLKHKFEV